MLISNLHDIDLLDKQRKEIAELKRVNKELSDKLFAELGVGKHQGDFCKATIYMVDKPNYDMEAFLSKVSPQFARAHTTITTYPVIRTSILKMPVAA